MGRATQRVLERIRLAIAWPAITVLAVGVLALWVSALYSLVTTGGFAGIAAWQTLGMVILSYQIIKTSERAVELRNGQSEALYAMRRRLWTIVGIVALSILANMAAIFLIIKNLADGRLQWTILDTVCYVIVGFTLAVLFIINRRQLLSNQASLFWIVVSTRMVPQVLLAFSPELKDIPWPVLWGMLMITGQRVLVSSIEFFEAKAKALPGKNIANARWILWADTGNMLTITTPIVMKLYIF